MGRVVGRVLWKVAFGGGERGCSHVPFPANLAAVELGHADRREQRVDDDCRVGLDQSGLRVGQGRVGWVYVCWPPVT